MNTGKKTKNVFALAILVVLALPFVTQDSSALLAQGGGQHVIRFPQAAVNIVLGEKVRTTLVNRGTSPILGVVVSVFDRNGVLVREYTRDVAPGAMEFSQVSCAVPVGIVPPPGPCPGVRGAAQADDGSTPLHTAVGVHRAHTLNLWISTAVVSDRTGSAGTGYVSRLSTNHNETFVRDLAPMP